MKIFIYSKSSNFRVEYLKNDAYITLFCKKVAISFY